MKEKKHSFLSQLPINRSHHLTCPQLLCHHKSTSSIPARKIPQGRSGADEVGSSENGVLRGMSSFLPLRFGLEQGPTTGGGSRFFSPKPSSCWLKNPPRNWQFKAPEKEPFLEGISTSNQQFSGKHVSFGHGNLLLNWKPTRCWNPWGTGSKTKRWGTTISLEGLKKNR